MKKSLCKRVRNESCSFESSPTHFPTHSNTSQSMRNNLRNPYLNSINHYCSFDNTETMRNTMCNKS